MFEGGEGFADGAFGAFGVEGEGKTGFEGGDEGADTIVDHDTEELTTEGKDPIS